MNEDPADLGCYRRRQKAFGGWKLTDGDLATKFLTRLDRVLSARNSLLCVGLDPDPAQLPTVLRRLPVERRLRVFVEGIVKATLPYTAAYKVQLASYLAFGVKGMQVMGRIPGLIGPRRIRILDLKANDIPNTMRLFHYGAFSEFGFDAITLTPWLGWETLGPFLEDAAHGIFLVVHSSNPGAPDFQEIPTPRGPLWLAAVGEARRLAHTHGNVGVVVGSTYSDAIRAARAALGDAIPILVPGVGAQGGQLSSTVREGVDGKGRALLVNASRSILFASSGRDWKDAAGTEAKRLMTQINQLRSSLRTK